MSKDKEQRFKNDIAYRIYRILHLAKKYKWTLQKNDSKKCEFINKEGCELHVNYHDLKIATALNHPKWGNTVLERKGELTQKIIESIFRNPRAHMPPNKVKSEYKPINTQL